MVLVNETGFKDVQLVARLIEVAGQVVHTLGDGHKGDQKRLGVCLYVGLWRL